MYIYIYISICINSKFLVLHSGALTFFRFQITSASVSVAIPQPTGKMAKTISFEIAFAQEESYPEEIALAQQVSQVAEKTQIEKPASSNTFSFPS